MQTSETIDALAVALAKAQAALRNAPLDKTNPHFKNQYATLASIRDTVTPVLAKHGLSVVQGTETVDGYFALYTRLLHESGQWIESAYPLPMHLDKPQAMGSAMTYARRYSLAAICNIVGDDDDDAEAAQGVEPAKQTAKKPVKNGASDAGETYTNMALGIIKNTKVSADELRKWWEEERDNRIKNSITKEQLETMKEAVMVKLDEITQKEATQ